MKIFATFANRKYDPQIAELLTAWDEGSVEENPNGYHAAVAASLADLGDDLLRHVEVTIDVHGYEIVKALNPATSVVGVVTSVEVSR